MKTVNNIPAGIYSGYLWRSDTTAPHVYDNESMDGIMLQNLENPFKIEGQLYDKDNQRAYSIKYVDGQYMAYECELKELENLECTEHSYIASFKDAPGMLIFKQYWREREDDLCEGMMVSYPAEFVYVGFNKIGE